jgi:hypothetical protein
MLVSGVGVGHNGGMLRVCISLLAISVMALVAASCAQTGAAMAGAETAQVAVVGAEATTQAVVAAATQVSQAVQQEANQIVTNVENGAAVALQPILPTSPGQSLLVVDTLDAYVIVQNGKETIAFKPQMWAKIEQFERNQEDPLQSK